MSSSTSSSTSTVTISSSPDNFTFQFSVTEVFQTNQPRLSPPFSTHLGIINWQLQFEPSHDPEYFTLSLLWIRTPEELRSGQFSTERSRIKSFCLFVKDASHEFIERKWVDINSFRGRWHGSGISVQRQDLMDNVICGVEFGIPQSPERQLTSPPSGAFPDSLKTAWRDQLKLPIGNVRFDFGDRSLFAFSTVLSRSSYFRSLFERVGNEAESDYIVRDRDFNPARIPDTDQPYNFDVTDCSYETFHDMLTFLYTNEVPFKKHKNGDQLQLAVDIFSVSDKYMVTDLKMRAMQVIWDSLTDDNISDLLFADKFQHPDLIEMLSEYFVSRFEFIRGTESFNGMVTNLRLPVNTSVGQLLKLVNKNQ